MKSIDEAAEVVIESITRGMSGDDTVYYADAMDIARANFSAAVDQRSCFDSLSDSIESYLYNAIDTSYEKGVSKDDVIGMFEALVDALRKAIPADNFPPITHSTHR